MRKHIDIGVRASDLKACFLERSEAGEEGMQVDEKCTYLYA